MGKLRTMVANTTPIYKVPNKLANEAFVGVEALARVQAVVLVLKGCAAQ